MGVSEIFYAELWEQLRDNPENASLPRWLREERREKGRDFSGETLEGLLGLLADRNRKLQLDSESQAWLYGLGERAGALPAPRGGVYTPRDRKLYKRLLSAFTGHPDAVSPEELEKLRGLVLEASVRQEAWEFLSNAGFLRPRQAAEHDLDNPESFAEDDGEDGMPRRKPRRNDRVLGMLDRWCSETGRTLGQPGTGSPASPASTGLASREDWHAMWQALQRTPGEPEIILPVRADPVTGIGLYLVGIGNFRDPELKRQMRKDWPGKPFKCLFVCFGPSEFEDETDFVSGKPGKKLAYGARLSMHPLQGITSYCVTLEDGEALFAYLLRQETAAFGYFRTANLSAPAGTPDSLKIFFDPGVEAQQPRPTAEEGRRAAQEDAARWAQKGKG